MCDDTEVTPKQKVIAHFLILKRRKYPLIIKI